ncbi:MAG TPA: helix-turn-helix transcriptional regulator [Ferruginibacter sp.]|nr:helix-turn-helix transcriptional regulator [Ferruginibacter sp.]HMP22305.1 helix-turn-helix transcriptional regulator [Ferruginibacter sp.]
MKDGIYLIEMGKRIRAIRKAKGIPIQKAAVMSGTYKSSLSDIETGKMNVKILALKRIADVLEVDVKDFL